MSNQRKPDTPILAGLICFGIAAIVLGAMHLGRVIKPPRVTAGTYQSPEDLDAQQRIALATLDTDKDTLSDLDELERTFTSPYLADSDSDGVDDAKELAAGTDPNCPTGQECAAIVREETAPERTPIPQDGTTLGAASASPLDLSRPVSGNTALPSGDALTKMIAGLGGGTPNIASMIDSLPDTAPEIRKSLLLGGMQAGELEKLTDVQILDLWEKVIGDLRVQATAASPAP